MNLTAIYDPRYRLRVGASDRQRAAFHEYLRREDSYITVGEVRGRVVSFSNGYLTVPAKAFAQTAIGVLENLYVVEELRRKGIGRQAAEYAIKWLNEKGAHEIFVNVIPKNGASLEFWQGMGFSVRRLAMTRQS